MARTQGDGEPAGQPGAYQQALALTAQIDAVIGALEARFHHKDVLDRSSTVAAISIAQAGGESTKLERRRQYRVARRAIVECIVVLDILGRQGAAEHKVAPARALASRLVEQVAHLERM